ncbi:unnamed protein product [Mytilus edulis]|uniref:Uncharacterized protein n=1 Tax=Mytilus edulis TaxID=6550 RepID=A0A8S3TN13_MYTED|nr:unnamed protein product [Mytilus edulis]
MPNLRWVDCRQIPCLYCTMDLDCRRQMALISSLTDNTNFSKMVVGLYHTILHGSISKSEDLLYYGDNTVLMGFVSEQHIVTVDGFYKEDDIFFLVCKHEGDILSDYKCPLAALQDLVAEDEEIEAVIEGMIPFTANIVVSANNTVSSVSIDM